MKYIFSGFYIVISLTISTNCFALSYQAVAVETKNGIKNQSKIFVKNNFVRIEYFVNNKKVVQISNPKKKKSWVLLVDEKTYIESSSVTDILPNQKKINLKKKCSSNRVFCEKISFDVINQRKTTKWKISVEQKDKVVSYLVWIDSEFGFPVKQMYEDGSYSELKFLKDELVQGRKTQKWQLTLVNRYKDKINIIQWYDNKLNLTIRETYPDGSKKELSDIKIKEFENQLFEIPKNYKKSAALF